MKKNSRGKKKSRKDTRNERKTGDRKEGNSDEK